MDFLKSLNTRWRLIGPDQGYRLACSDAECSLSCANLKKGKISVTSTHGTERHSYELTKIDMCFAFIEFIEALSEKEQQSFVNIVNEFSENKVIAVNNIDKKYNF